jgi:membrane protease YdiL (CAAX protease family)
MPTLSVAAYWWLRLAGVPLPEPRIFLGGAVWMFVGFFVFAIGEELGWSGYLMDDVQERFGALGAGTIIGVMWATWHVPTLVQAGRHADWIAWWALGTVGSRVVMVWLYHNTNGSVFGAALYHAMINLCWQLFPNSGLHYDPRITSMLVVTVAVGVTAWPDPRTRRGPAGG